MLLGDCYNNFVFINALQYAIYAYCISSFFRLKNKKTKKNNKTKKTKKQLLILKKSWFFAPLAKSKGTTIIKNQIRVGSPMIGWERIQGEG